MNKLDLNSLSKKIESIIEFEGKSCEAVFDVLGDPQKITDWYLLAKQIHMKDDSNFQVEFTFFGLVDEEILLWDAPNRYVYKATGDGFPIKDYVAEIKVEVIGENKGRLTWTIFYSEIEGEEFKRILPIMLPAINQASMEKLSGLIGGTKVIINNF